MVPRYSQKTIFNMADGRHLGFVITSSTALYVANCVKFLQRSVMYFLKYLVFHVSAFWLEIAYLWLNFDHFW